MTDTQKIYDWCDRQETKTREPYALQVSTFSIDSTKMWAATVQKFPDGERDWHHQSDITSGETPEEAIAKLAEALGL
jgi:hypothetical protein